MFLFGLYTVFVWWLAFGWRRRLLGVLAVIAGVFGLLPIKALIAMVPDPAGESYSLGEVLLYPYMGLLLLGGLYIVILPRRKEPTACGVCSYDLSGHKTDIATCPECGTHGQQTRAPARRLAAKAVEHAKPRDPRRQPRDQHPPEPAAG